MASIAELAHLNYKDIVTAVVDTGIRKSPEPVKGFLAMEVSPVLESAGLVNEKRRATVSFSRDTKGNLVVNSEMRKGMALEEETTTVYYRKSKS